MICPRWVWRVCFWTMTQSQKNSLTWASQVCILLDCVKGHQQMEARSSSHAVLTRLEAKAFVSTEDFNDNTQWVTRWNPHCVFSFSCVNLLCGLNAFRCLSSTSTDQFTPAFFCFSSWFGFWHIRPLQLNIKGFSRSLLVRTSRSLLGN